MINQLHKVRVAVIQAASVIMENVKWEKLWMRS